MASFKVVEYETGQTVLVALTGETAEGNEGVMILADYGDKGNVRLKIGYKAAEAAEAALEKFDASDLAQILSPYFDLLDAVDEADGEEPADEDEEDFIEITFLDCDEEGR